MSLINKVDQFNDDVDIAHEIVHGDSTTTVITKGGPVRSLAKLIADKDAEFVGGDVVQQAMAARDASKAAKTAAELARDAAFINADVYPDVATGRAAVADGEQYQIVSSDGTELIRYRRENAGWSVEVARMQTRQQELSMKVHLESNLEIDLTSREIRFPSNVSYIYTTTGRIALNGGEVVSYPSSGNQYYILYNKTTKEISAVAFSGLASALNSQNYYYLFKIDHNKRLLDGYSSDFKFVGGGAQVIQQAKNNYSLALVTSNNLNFNFNNNKIEVLGNIWILYDGGRIQIAPTEVELPTDRNIGFKYVLMVNPTTSELLAKSIAAPFSVPKDYLMIGAYHERDLLFWGIDKFSVNGVPFQKENSVRPSFGWDVNNTVNVDVLDSFTSTDPIPVGNLTSSIVYGWFDSLATDYPDYVTKTLLGNDASGTLPIYQYRFKPKVPFLRNSGVSADIPKVMLITLHNEGINMIALHILMREICQSWQDSDSLASMRNGLEFVVIPVGNPWGLNNAKRTNSNQVDINRQFPSGWIAMGSPGDYFYSGTAALTEAEAQHIYASIVTEKPDVYFDVHSYGAWNNEGCSAWIPIYDAKTNSAIISAATKIYSQYKKKYPWLVDTDKLIEISNGAIVGGGISAKTAVSLGAVGSTFETSWNLKDAPDGAPIGHTPAINFTADLLGTCILQSLGVIIDSR